MLAAVIEVAASKGAKRRGFIVQAPSVRGWESQARRRGHREIPPSRRPPRAGHARQERRRRNHARHARQTFRRSASACRNRRCRTAPTRRDRAPARTAGCRRSEEHTSELQSLMRISYAVFCLKKKKQQKHTPTTTR